MKTKCVICDKDNRTGGYFCDICRLNWNHMWDAVDKISDERQKEIVIAAINSLVDPLTRREVKIV